MSRSNYAPYILVMTARKVFRGDRDNVARTPSLRAIDSSTSFIGIKTA